MMKQILLTTFFLFWMLAGPGFADQPADPAEKNDPLPGEEDMKVIAAMDILELMELVENIDLMKDLDYIIEEDPNEK